MIGFGVGNTTHAATLHASVQTRRGRRPVARHPRSRRLVSQTRTGDVLHDRKVSVFINDGRQHLQMTPPATYDLITLEPPPIAHAGVAALYSREFYRAGTRRA